MSRALFHTQGKNGEVVIQCPGCGGIHVLPTTKPHGWEFNGDLDKPTFKPSILVKYRDKLCHSYVTDGKIQFLSDCTHEFKNQTLDLPDVDPKWAS